MYVQLCEGCLYHACIYTCVKVISKLSLSCMYTSVFIMYASSSCIYTCMKVISKLSFCVKVISKLSLSCMYSCVKVVFIMYIHLCEGD